MSILLFIYTWNGRAWISVQARRGKHIDVGGHGLKENFGIRLLLFREIIWSLNELCVYGGFVYSFVTVVVVLSFKSKKGIAVWKIFMRFSFKKEGKIQKKNKYSSWRTMNWMGNEWNGLVVTYFRFHYLPQHHQFSII